MPVLIGTYQRARGHSLTGRRKRRAWKGQNEASPPEVSGLDRLRRAMGVRVRGEGRLQCRQAGASTCGQQRGLATRLCVALLCRFRRRVAGWLLARLLHALTVCRLPLLVPRPSRIRREPAARRREAAWGCGFDCRGFVVRLLLSYFLQTEYYVLRSGRWSPQ